MRKAQKPEMSSRLAIGIDLGGTQVRAALVEDGRLLKRAAMPTDVAGGPQAVMQQFFELITQVCPREQWQNVAAVGVCAPGPLDSESGVVLHIPTLPGWDDFPLRETLRQELQRPVFLENDGIAAAYGEWKFGAGRGLQHMVYVTVSTGIGGGVVVDDRLMHGRRGMAAHVGHFRMSLTGARCSCGAVGCFEALASGSALGERGRANSKDSVWLRQVQGTVGTRNIVEGARAGDEICQNLIAEQANLLGIGFTSLLHLYSPQRLVMGGGVSKAFDLLDAGIHRVIEADALPPFRNIKTVPAELGDNSGLIGAAALALN